MRTLKLAGGNVLKRKFIFTSCLALVISMVQAVSAQAANYYPSGPQLNVPESSVTGGGWTLCFEDNFLNRTVPVESLTNSCTGKYILVAGKLDSTSSTFDLLAAGERSVVLTPQTVGNATTLNNGTYWYFFPTPIDWEDKTSESIGFAPSSNTNIYTCDYGDAISEESPYKFCRHIRDGKFDDGYRIGPEGTVNENSKMYFYQMDSVNGIDNNAAAAARAKQEQEQTLILGALAAALASLSTGLLSAVSEIARPKRSIITCIKGKAVKKVSSGVCPKGYKKKK